MIPECGPPPAGRVAIDHVDGVSDEYWLYQGIADSVGACDAR